MLVAAAISATLYGHTVTADEQGHDEETKENQKRIPVYFGLGVERPNVPLDAVFLLRAEQREATSLQYLEPRSDRIVSNHEDYSLFAGVEITEWLDVELAAHAMSSFYDIQDSTSVVDTSLAGNNIKASHFSKFEESTYSLTVLPRWDMNKFFGVYGRLGIGYTDTMLESRLKSIGQVASKEVCTTDPSGTQRCHTEYDYAENTWSDVRLNRSKWFPIVGVGIDIAQTVRLEYLLRTDIPIGDTTVDIDSGIVWIRLFPWSGKF